MTCILHNSEITFREVKSALIGLRRKHLLRALLEPIQDYTDVYYQASFRGQRFNNNTCLKLGCRDSTKKAWIIHAYVLVIDETRGLLLKPTAKAAGQCQRLES